MRISFRGGKFPFLDYENENTDKKLSTKYPYKNRKIDRVVIIESKDRSFE